MKWLLYSDAWKRHTQVNKSQQYIQEQHYRHQCVRMYLQILMSGHDCYLVTIDTKNFPLKIDQLTLTHLHIVPSLEVVFSFLTCQNQTT